MTLRMPSMLSAGVIKGLSLPLASFPPDRGNASQGNRTRLSYTVIPITWTNRKTGVSKLKIKEMGSRYLFIVFTSGSKSSLAIRLPARGQRIRGAPDQSRHACRILVTGGPDSSAPACVWRSKRANPAPAIVALDNLHRRGSELNLTVARLWRVIPHAISDARRPRPCAALT